MLSLSRVVATSGLLLIALLVFLTMRPAYAGSKDQAIWVEAWGHSAMTRGDTQDTAKRRALLDALVAAAMQGGATLRGYTFVDKSVVQADRALLLAKGQVLSHKVLDSTFDGNLWRVRVKALVGPVPAGICGGSRSLLITATMPNYSISPAAPAWTAEMSQTMFNDMMRTVERNRATKLERVIATSSTGQPASSVPTGMNYNALMTGTAPTAAKGDHILSTTFDVDVVLSNAMKAIVLNVDLAFKESNGNIRRHRISRTAPLPKNTTLHQLTLRNRTTAEGMLSNGVLKEFNSVLSALGCEPPSARLALAGKSLSVPIGASHGITRGALAVVDDPNDSFGLLEITKLENGRATLRPLDPSRSASSYAGRLVYFMEAGL